MSNEVRGLVVRPDGAAEFIEIDPRLEDIREAIGGGWLEGVAGPAPHGDWVGYCDEEGKLKGQPVNEAATILARRLGWPGGDYLVGTVVFFGIEDRGGETGKVEVSLSERVTSEIEAVFAGG